MKAHRARTSRISVLPQVAPVGEQVDMPPPANCGAAAGAALSTGPVPKRPLVLGEVSLLCDFFRRLGELT